MSTVKIPWLQTDLVPTEIGDIPPHRIHVESCMIEFSGSIANIFLLTYSLLSDF